MSHSIYRHIFNVASSQNLIPSHLVSLSVVSQADCLLLKRKWCYFLYSSQVMRMCEEQKDALSKMLENCGCFLLFLVKCVGFQTHFVPMPHGDWKISSPLWLPCWQLLPCFFYFFWFLISQRRTHKVHFSRGHSTEHRILDSLPSPILCIRMKRTRGYSVTSFLTAGQSWGYVGAADGCWVKLRAGGFRHFSCHWALAGGTNAHRSSVYWDICLMT